VYIKHHKLLLILALAILAGINFYLDHQTTTFNPNGLMLLVFCSVATALPSLISYIIASKTSFNIYKVNIYKLASNIILFGSIVLWLYLLFFRERPSYYDGASHLYVATWPIVIGVFTLLLFILCLVIQSCFILITKHNK